MKNHSIQALLVLSCLISIAPLMEAKCWSRTDICYNGDFTMTHDWFYAHLTAATYNVVFSGESAYDSNSNSYMVCPNSALNINNINTIVYGCNDGVSHSESADLVAWVYDGAGNQVAMNYNNYGPRDADTLRSEVIPGVANKGACMKGNGLGNHMTVYNFNDATKTYTVYIDQVTGYCPTCCVLQPYIKTLKALKNFNVGVASNPSVSITAPQPVTTSPLSTIPLAWTITNTGSNLETISISKNCGGYSCGFVSYTDNHVLTLTPGQSYTVVLDIFTTSSSTCGNAAITVTYDDGYGFSCIQPKTLTSSVPISLANGCSGTTTSPPVTTTLCKSNTQVCTSGGECCSGVCNCGYCCNSGECGWGTTPAVCVPNGQRRSNQWLDGICVNGRWDTYTCGWGCNTNSCSPGGGKFDCYSGSCALHSSDGNYYCDAGSCNPATTTTIPPSPVNDASFVSQSVPPMCAGRSFVVSVTMKNIGSTTWTAAGNYRLGSQNPQDNTIWGTGRAYLSGSDSIAPGAQKTFSFTVTAPSTTGTYNFQWRMLRENVEWFGQTTPNIAVNVNSCPAATTTTTSSSSSSSSSTTSTTLYKRIVTLRFIVNDDHSSKLNCTLFTNVSSTWKVNRTLIGVNANEVNHTVLYGVSEGMYGWTVSCSDGLHQYIFPRNASRTDGVAPGQYWIFYVRAPAITTTTTTTLGGGTTTTTTTTTTKATTSTTIVVCKSNTQACASASECCSGVCNCGYCCNSGECGWGTTPAVCVANGQRRSNQWLDGICVNGRWDTYTCGWGCDINSCSPGGGKFDCYSGACNLHSSDGKYYCDAGSCNPTTTTTTTTIPSIIPGNSDVVLVTDLSGSMMYCLDGSMSGCSYASGCPNTPAHANGCTDVNGNNPVRFQLAQNLSKDFIDQVLSRPNNKVAVVAFAGSAGTAAPYLTSLSSDPVYLKGQIAAYTANNAALGSLTCSCCGIRAAGKILTDQSGASRNKYIIFMSDGVANMRCNGVFPDATPTTPYAACAPVNCGIADVTPTCTVSGYPYAIVHPNQAFNCNKATGAFKNACMSSYDTVSISNAKRDACSVNTAVSGLKIYSIGMFNSQFVSGCSWGATSLSDISGCGSGQTFIGTTTSELGTIYAKF